MKEAGSRRRRTAGGSARSRRVSKCPRCGSVEVLPIEYGYPGPEMIAAAERGKIHLGGCCVSERDPTLKCNACGKEFGRPGGSSP